MFTDKEQRIMDIGRLLMLRNCGPDKKVHPSNKAEAEVLEGKLGVVDGNTKSIETEYHRWYEDHHEGAIASRPREGVTTTDDIGAL